MKRIWTPSWTLFSGGWCCLLMAAFYFIIDLRHRRAWAFPFIVIGLNSIAAYCMAHLFEDFIRSTLITHLGAQAFQIFGKPYAPLLLGFATLLILWAILFWMQRRKIFLRI